MGRKYWVISLKSVLKNISRHCVVCRQHGHPDVHVMAPLPDYRTKLTRAFKVTGVDLAGPVTLREGATRKPVLFKAWICVFVCMVTKAIHLDVCKGLSVEEFRPVFTRFCSRRGTPDVVLSDNGSNFTGVAEDIKKEADALLMKFGKTRPAIQWKFNPPRAPNFGGLWEAGVKSAKKLLVKMIQPHPLRFDEIYTVLTSVEAVLNSRPMLPLDQVETEDDFMLTPGHFLVGGPLVEPPLGNTKKTSEEHVSTLRRWQLQKKLSHMLQDNFQKHYLDHLQTRHRWNTKKNRNIQTGDVVYIKDSELLKKTRWPLARVEKVFPGKDGCVRVATVRCGGRSYKRATSSLIHVFSTPPGEVQVSKEALSKPGPQDVQVSAEH